LGLSWTAPETYCHPLRRRILTRLLAYKAKGMTEEINDAFHGSNYFQFEDLEIGFFRDEDVNGRRRQFIEFQLSVSKEQQHLNSLKATQPPTPTPTNNESTNN